MPFNELWNDHRYSTEFSLLGSDSVANCETSVIKFKTQAALKNSFFSFWCSTTSAKDRSSNLTDEVSKQCGRLNKSCIFVNQTLCILSYCMPRAWYLNFSITFAWRTTRRISLRIRSWVTDWILSPRTFVSTDCFNKFSGALKHCMLCEIFVVPLFLQQSLHYHSYIGL